MDIIRTFLVVTLFASVIVITSCVDEGVPDGYYDPLSCSTELTPIYVFKNAKVTYKISASGEYQLDSILWTDDEGEHTETDFTLPFEQEAEFAGDADYRLQIDGSVTNGIINLEASVEQNYKVVSTQTSNCSKTID